jgi:hypothetical protein
MANIGKVPTLDAQGPDHLSSALVNGHAAVARALFEAGADPTCLLIEVSCIAQ